MNINGTSNLKEKEMFDLMLNYFSTIVKNLEISADETKMFLMLYLEYVLRLYRIDSSQINTNINLVKKLAYNNMEAYLQYFEKQNKFEFYFLRDDFKLAFYNNKIYTNLPKSKRLIPRLVQNENALHHFIYKLTISGHEFHHVVQLLTNRGAYADYLKEREEAIRYFETSATKENFKLLAKETSKRLEDIDFKHPMEIEANVLSYKYMLWLLNELINRAKDDNLKKFLFDMKCNVEDDSEDKYLEYMAHNCSRRTVNRSVGNCNFFENDDDKMPEFNSLIIK